MCQAFGCLPSEGGLFDQDFLIAYGMYYVIDAQAELRKLEWDKKHKERSRG
jgi:hypothetical protein